MPKVLHEFSFKDSVWHCMFMYVEDTEKELETRNWKGVRVMWCACVLFADSSISEDIFQRTLIQVDQCAKWSVGRTPTDRLWTDSKCIRQFQFSAVASCKLIGKRLDNVVLLLQWCLIQYTYSVGWSAEAGNQFLQVPIIRVLAWALCRSGLKVGSKKHQCRRSSVVTYKSCSTILELNVFAYADSVWAHGISRFFAWAFYSKYLSELDGAEKHEMDEMIKEWIWWSSGSWLCHAGMLGRCNMYTTHYYTSRRTTPVPSSRATVLGPGMWKPLWLEIPRRPNRIYAFDIFWHSVGLKDSESHCSDWEPSTGVLILAVLPNVIECYWDRYR
jgi:hypothetical protein